MADNVVVTAGSGTTIGADEVVDGTLGTVKVQYVKLMDGTIDGTSKLVIGTSGARVDMGGNQYETVDVSVTAQVLGGSISPDAGGAVGDYIAGVLIIPATTSPGNVILLDGTKSITLFTGGASSVSNLVPFMVPLGMLSAVGAWKLTTGANVQAIGVGRFT